jgi:hypothetical protein
MIMRMMGLASLFSYSRASRQCYIDVHSLIASRMVNILSDFITDPRHLLVALERTGSILSGSAVVCMLLPDAAWRPRDLDIYTTVEGHRSMVSFLRYKGYQVTHVFAFWDSNVDQLAVGKFRHGVTGKGIDLIVVRSANPVPHIFTFHSTLPMNFLSAHGIYCAYPELLDAKLCMVNPHHDWTPERRYQEEEVPPLPENVHRFLVFLKYLRRGFKVKDWAAACENHSGRCRVDPSCIQTRRFLHRSGGAWFSFLPQAITTAQALPFRPAARMGDAYFDRTVHWCIAERPPLWTPADAISYYEADREEELERVGAYN